MQERVYYEDEALRVTASEIRAKRRTIRTNSVISVGVASVRPGRWFPVLMLIPRAPMVILMAIVVVLSFWRVDLQTSGGPVVLAVKAELGGVSATLARYDVIQNAIEQAMRAA